MRILGYLACLMLLLPTAIFSQELGEEEVAPPMEQGGVAQSSPSFGAEKAELIQILKRDIEPNLPPADAKKIRRNVMRLGSYNAEWAQEAREFLLANSALAELFLYDYSRIHNARLNAKILEVLKSFENYQYPMAGLYFSDDLLKNDEGVEPYLDLVKNIVSRNPSVFDAYFTWMFSPAARDLDFGQRLNFLRVACRAGASFPLDLRSQVDTWASENQELWSRVFLEEVRACLKGL